MTLDDFVSENRQEIRDAIARFYGENCRPSNDKETKEWVNNDEGLYSWARSQGVRI